MFKSAMVYPTVILTFAGFVLLALVAFLVPGFVGLFTQSGGDLPFITKITASMSAGLMGYRSALIALTAGAISCFASGSAPRADAASGRLPPAHPGEDPRHPPEGCPRAGSRTVSALVNAGVPLLAALDQVAAAVKSLTSIFEAVMLVVMGGIVGVYDQIR